jgi:hypothetical protein
MPKPEGVTNFPFLTMSSEDIRDPLKTLADFIDGCIILPQPGALWLAAGVKMRAFGCARRHGSASFAADIG